MKCRLCELGVPNETHAGDDLYLVNAVSSDGLVVPLPMLYVDGHVFLQNGDTLMDERRCENGHDWVKVSTI